MDQYTVKLQKSGRFDKTTWDFIEYNQRNEHTIAVNNMLIDCIKNKPEDSFISESFIILGNVLYKYVITSTGIKFPLDKKVKEECLSKKDKIRLESSKKKLNLLVKDIKDAYKNKTYKRFLSHEIYEIRGITLMLFIQDAIAEKWDIISANELDLAIQKFNKVSKGCSYLNRSNSIYVSSEFVNNITYKLAQLRKIYPFNGSNLATNVPRIIWKTKYDICLVSKPVRVKYNQQCTINLVRKYIECKGIPFLIINRAPPGAGKSALVVPIAYILRKSSENLYICAGQGRSGVIQFVQSLYSAAIPVSIACIEKEEIKIIRQYASKHEKCNVFVGTADAIKLLIANNNKSFILVIDEPTYGADISNSEACLELMSLITNLPENNRRAIMLSATFPRIENIPKIVNHFQNVSEVIGGDDSIQIAYSLYTLSGRRILPHQLCKNAEDIALIIYKIKNIPLIARIYSIDIVVQLYRYMVDNKIEKIPDVEKIFNSVENLLPVVVGRVIISLLECLALQPNNVIAAITQIEYEPVEPIDFEKLEISIPFKSPNGPMAVIVDTEPILLATTSFKSILDRLEIEGHSNVHEIYNEFNRNVELRTRAELSAELSKSKSAYLDNMYDQPIEMEEVKLKFPAWAQINTRAHAAKIGYSAANCRQSVILENILQCDVPDVLQLLLLCGVGVFTTRNINCQKYQFEVWKQASAGTLAYLITDHSGCYGANMLTNTLIITEQFTSVSSLSTIEQAGGRLCRVGLTYSGRFYIPENTAELLLLDIKNTTEATNMESAFN